MITNVSRNRAGLAHWFGFGTMELDWKMGTQAICLRLAAFAERYALSGFSRASIRDVGVPTAAQVRIFAADKL